MRIYKDIDAKSLATLPLGYLVKLVDACEWLGVSDESLRRYVKDGRIKAVEEQGTHGREGWRYAFETEELNRVKRLSRTVERVVLP